jgi:succinate dehydrogenase/fumarate reductase flavoprotein subunit
VAAEFDELVDVVVVGSGGGALTGAYLTAAAGLATVVLESTDRFGGTTAYSGAGLWLPGNPVLRRAGVQDSADEAREYLRAVVGEESAALQDAFLDSAAAMVAELEKNPVLPFEYRPFPDYFDAAPNSLPLGRDIFPIDMDRAELGELADVLRPALPTERLGLPDPAELSGGQALIGRLLLACQGTGCCDLRAGTPMTSLIVDGDRVVGVVATVDSQERWIGARHGVLMAAGGFERNAEMRERYRVPGAVLGSMGAPGGSGRPIEAAVEIGAAVDLMDQCWWSPGLTHPDGTSTFTLGLSGGIFVNSVGERFANESLPYDQMGRAVLAGETTGTSHVPFWLVFDGRFGTEMPAMSTVPIIDRDAYVEAGIWRTADTLEGLAAAIGVPAENLVRTVDRFNVFARNGKDEDFTRGEHPYDLFFASGTGSNPALVPIEDGPFHAVQFGLSDLGTKGGLVTDTVARVQRADGTTIGGLYAAGNTMASMTRDTYPGPGTPVGTCMVFAYLAALDMIERARAESGAQEAPALAAGQ